MKIIETDFKWGGGLTNRPQTLYIALHHRAGDGDAESIHKQHLNQGWSGIGYHFYIRKDGSIYRGRPIDKMGAHITGYNSCAIGICFEGNYHTENKIMPSEQIKAGQEIVSYLKEIYPNARVVGHRDLQATACPGDYFPFEKIVKGEAVMDIETAKKILKEKAGLDDTSIQYLMFYKYGKDLVIKLAKAMG